jgi:hypothetical protein
MPRSDELCKIELKIAASRLSEWGSPGRKWGRISTPNAFARHGGQAEQRHLTFAFGESESLKKLHR